jgi:hypothetical protein
MSEDEASKGRKRGSNNNALALLEQTMPKIGDGAIVPADKSNVGTIVTQFEPGAPPSPSTVRDPKRKRHWMKKGRRRTSQLIWWAPWRGATRLNECLELQLSRSGQCLDSQRDA